MAILIQAIGGLVGAFAGLMLGTMVKFNIDGTPVDLRYVFMLFGILAGYALARLVTREPKTADAEADDA